MSDLGIESARFQWEGGTRRLREQPAYEGIMAAVVDELRRRLGSTFSLAELAEHYAADVDWALDLAERLGAEGEAAWVADAAFDRYAREAADFGGGLRRVTKSG